MLVQVPAIKPETRKLITTVLDEHFRTLTHSERLQSVVDEVLNDRDLFTFFSTFLDKGEGMMVGHFSYWDDTQVNVDYGLTINFDNTPRRTHLFVAEKFGAVYHDFKLCRTFPDYSTKEVQNFPFPELFAQQVNYAIAHSLINPGEDIFNIGAIERLARHR